MSEAIAIQKMKQPNTVASLEVDLKNLGLKEGMTVLVHSSMSALGWVCGGEQAVVEALMKVVTENGTLVMPTHSGVLSDPSHWECPPVPKEWWQQIRDTMPAFDPKVTPTRGMGKIIECFRNYEGVKRSYHPTVSFAAWGKNADKIVADHQLAFGLGERSPLQAIYELDGHVLLLGVGHSNNTSLHLSEFYSTILPSFQQGSPIIENGIRVWKEYEELEGDSDKFEAIGKDFEIFFEIKTGKVGNAQAKLMNQAELVDFGSQWLVRKHFGIGEAAPIDEAILKEWEATNQKNIHAACEVHGEQFRKQFEKWGEMWDTAYLTNYDLWEFGDPNTVLESHSLELPTPVLEAVLKHFKDWKFEESVFASDPIYDKDGLIKAYDRVTKQLIEEINSRGNG